MPVRERQKIQALLPALKCAEHLHFMQVRYLALNFLFSWELEI